MVFKIIISFICELYRFYPVLPMGKTDCWVKLYPILPNWFYPLGKTYMPTLDTSYHAETTTAIKCSSIIDSCSCVCCGRYIVLLICCGIRCPSVVYFVISSTFAVFISWHCDTVSTSANTTHCRRHATVARSSSLLWMRLYRDHDGHKT